MLDCTQLSRNYNRNRCIYAPDTRRQTRNRVSTQCSGRYACACVSHKSYRNCLSYVPNDWTSNVIEEPHWSEEEKNPPWWVTLKFKLVYLFNGRLHAKTSWYSFVENFMGFKIGPYHFSPGISPSWDIGKRRRKRFISIETVTRTLEPCIYRTVNCTCKVYPTFSAENLMSFKMSISHFSPRSNRKWDIGKKVRSICPHLYLEGGSILFHDLTWLPLSTTLKWESSIDSESKIHHVNTFIENWKNFS